jgi:archaellum biogenesis ATPase FlaH
VDTQEALQTIILRSIINDDAYMRQVIPYIEPDYFEGVYCNLFKGVAKYVAKYNKLPTKESFSIYLPESGLIGNNAEEAYQVIPKLFEHITIDLEWLLETTERWCQDRALHNAIMESIGIINDEEKSSITRNGIPDILIRALAVGFNRNIGHDYIDNWDERYEFYHEKLERIPFDIDILNLITNGGLIRKTLTIIMAGTGVGKSLTMCHMASANLAMGYNVLYITAEMAEERIAERIDANLLNVPLDQLMNLSKPMFKDRVDNLAKKTNGKLIIKEYPTAQAHSGHFRALLHELKLKKNFTPDIIYIDYLNICASARIKSMGGAINSYSYIKAIAEELRGLSVEFNVPVVSATQTTRDGAANSDPELQDTSESFALPATSDLFLAAVSTDELAALGQIMFKQLKNRYRDLNINKRFVIGVDKSKMRLYDVKPEDQKLLQTAIVPDDDTPVFDNTAAGKRIKRDNLSFADISFDA